MKSKQIIIFSIFFIIFFIGLLLAANVKYDDFTKQTSSKDNISTFNPEDDFFQSQRFRFNQTIPLPDLPKGEKIIKSLGDIEVSYFS
ncbi:MAG: hypothetical protein QXO70_03830, partial [Candidatus Pacearchaeota archaeon]